MQTYRGIIKSWKQERGYVFTQPEPSVRSGDCQLQIAPTQSSQSIWLSYFAIFTRCSLSYKNQVKYFTEMKINLL